MAEDLLKWAMEKMAEYEEDFRHSEVTYRVGNQAITGVSASLGKSMLKRDSVVAAISILHTDRDFIITRTALVLSGQEIEPNNGHAIDIVEGGVTRRYEVTNFGLAERPWRWCDEHHIRRRIHTKFLKIVS